MTSEQPESCVPLEGDHEPRRPRRAWPLVVFGMLVIVLSAVVDVVGVGGAGFGGMQISLALFGVLVGLVGFYPRFLFALVRSVHLRRTVKWLGAAWCFIGFTLVVTAIAAALSETALRLLFRTERQRIHDFWNADVGTRPSCSGAGRPDVYALQQPTPVHWRPYVYVRRGSYRGPHVTIDADGRRRTWQPDGLPESRRRMFVFGGSAVWGQGARDDYTVPSCISKALFEAGLNVEVTNFGECAFVTTQEVIVLLRELHKGNIPDVVVFYDGVNDMLSAYQNRTTGLPQHEANRRLDLNLRRSNSRMLQEIGTNVRVKLWGFGLLSATVRRRLGMKRPRVDWRGFPDTTPEGDLQQDVVRVYEANMKVVEALGKGFGFSARFYWQPTVYAKSSLTPYEEELSKRFSVFSGFFTGVYDCLRGADHLERDYPFRDLSNLFTDPDEPYFYDFCHITEKGNEVVGREIAKDLAKSLAVDRHRAAGGR